MDRIRKARNAELVKKDITFMRAVEAGDTSAQTTIATEKQTLRDIPQKYDLSVFKTPEELKAAWPKELEELDEKIKDKKEESEKKTTKLFSKIKERFFNKIE